MKKSNSVVSANRRRKRPEDIIVGTDSIAIGLLKKIYAELKKIAPENLYESEVLWIKEVEIAYAEEKVLEGTQILSLLKQAQDILNQKSYWSPKDEEFYEVLEKIIFLRARENTFKEFFEDMETAVLSTLQLDFSKKASLSNITKDKRNLFNYASLSLNMIIEKMETSVVSVKAVNNMFSELPGTAVIVTDKNLSIRFINELGEKLVDTDRSELMGKSIDILFKESKEIIKKLSLKKPVKKINVNLISLTDNSLIPVTLTVPKPIEDLSEIEEFIFIAKINSCDKIDKVFDLTQESHNKLAPLNSITGIAELLKKRLIDKDSETLIDLLEKSVNSLRQNSEETLKAIKNNHYESNKKIDINQLVNDILDSLKFTDGFNEIKFEKNIDCRNILYSNARLVHSILFNLIHNAIRYRKKTGANKVEIIVNDKDASTIRFIIKDSGIGIPKEVQKKLFTKKQGISSSKDGHGLGLYIVKKAVDKLKGEIEVSSSKVKGTLFSVLLPVEKIIATARLEY